MSNSIKDQLNTLLDDLNFDNNIDASAVVSRDGLLITANMANELDAETFAAMTATMMGAAETAILELDKGKISQILVESDKSKILCIGAGKRALLVLTLLPSTELRVIRNNILSTKDKIVSLLNQY